MHTLAAMRTHTDRDIRLLVARSSVEVHHEPVELAGAVLEMAALPHVDLRGANLKGANLRGAMLWGARFDGACLDGADLTCSDLSWASLAGCSLRETLLVEAEMDETLVDLGLQGAVTAGAGMTTVTFTHDPDVVRQVREIREKYRSEVDASSGFRGLLARLRGALRGGRPDPGRDEAQLAEIRAVVAAHLKPPDEADEARDEAILRAHVQSASLELRRRGAAGFSLRTDPRVYDGFYAYKEATYRAAQVRVLSDEDVRALLAWSAATGKPLNLRGCDLSGADLRDAVLDGACLAYANLDGADTRGASFVGAEMSSEVA